MRICVLGAGVIGMTTALSLAKRGHDVTVIDAADGPARDTSRANGGQLSYAYVAPLADASIWKNMPSYLLGSDSPLRYRPALDAAQWRWLVAFLLACNRRTATQTTATLLQLAFFSRSCLDALQREMTLDFELRTSGKLVMHTSTASLEQARRQVELQAKFGCKQTVLPIDDCIAIEPALANGRSRWAGGVHTPSEQAGDCALFCEQLHRRMAQAGTVRFAFNRRVTGAVVRQGKLVALASPGGDIEADAFVLANGPGCAATARQMGFTLPVYPLKGYSLTFDIGDEAAVPATSVTDLARKIVYARLGKRLRVAGRLEIVGHDRRVDEATAAALAAEARLLFPALQESACESPAWVGLRPATPTGIPVIGRSPLANVYLNVGHGSLGWTLACGSAELLAKQVAGEVLTFDSHPFSYQSA